MTVQIINAPAPKKMLSDAVFSPRTWKRPIRLPMNEVRQRYLLGEATATLGVAFQCSPQTILRRLREDGTPTRDRRWRQPTYGAAHERLARDRGRPKECEECGTTDPTKRYEWASLTANYGDSTDYKRLCKACHLRFDDVHEKVGRQLRGRALPRQQGERHHMARLTDVQVLEIRARGGSGEEFKTLGTEFGISNGHIGRIVHRVNWRHLA